MIRRPRRTLAGAVLAAAVLLVAAPAEAQLGGWTIESFVAGGSSSESRQLTGRLTYDGPAEGTIMTANLDLVPSNGTPDSCATRDLEGSLSNSVPGSGVPGSRATATFTFANVAPFCNGTYVARVQATGTPGLVDATGQSPVLAPDPDVAINVDRPAPPVTGLTAAVAPDRAVTLTWNPPAAWEGGAPPDFDRENFAGAGYVVQRAVGDGPFEEIATTDPTTLTHVDSTAPPDAATARYRVVATRGNGQPTQVAVPGDFAAAPVTEARLTPEAPPTTPAPPTTRAPAANAPGRGGGGGGGARPAPPQTGPQVDDVFSETLPFDIEPGEADAVLPEDAAQFLQDDGGGGIDDIAGAGILVPSSIAALLASWALHLRYLARRAAIPG